MQIKLSLVAAATLIVPNLLHAQFDFHIDGRDVQVHSFLSQGFAYSNQNNFLTMPTSQGSFAMTDGGVNVSTQLTEKFRVGAQVYVRSIGQLGKWHPEIDFAYGDYRFADWFGIRGGKVKTVLGLYNDSQDMESLHTWAILPVSSYSLDLRASTISHTGGDVYGDLHLKRVGSLAYTAYWGTRSDDKNGGFYFSTQDNGSPITKYVGSMAGFDVRWTPKVSGLMVGVSWMDQMSKVNGVATAYGDAPYIYEADPSHVTVAYADYSRGKWRLDAEYHRHHEIGRSTVFGATSFTDSSDQGWFVSAAYRVSKLLELGTYHSRFYVAAPTAPGPAANHIFDQVVTARLDLTRFWDVKIEGHFMDGYGDLYSARGFYLRDNTNGLKPTTNMLVVRTGFTF